MLARRPRTVKVTKPPYQVFDAARAATRIAIRDLVRRRATKPER